MIVAAFLEAPDGELAESGFDLRAAFFPTFSFEVQHGPNVVAVWIDVNDNGLADAGDAFRIYPAYVFVQPGRTSSGFDIVLDQIVSIDRTAGRVNPSRRATITAALHHRRGQRPGAR